MSRLTVTADGPFKVTALASPDGTTITAYSDAAFASPVTLPHPLPAAGTLYLKDGQSFVDVTFALGGWSRTDRIAQRPDVPVELTLADVPSSAVLGAITAEPSTVTITGADSDDGELTFDVSVGNVFLTTLTEDITDLALTNPSVGQIVTLGFIQDDTGDWEVTWPAEFALTGGALTVTADAEVASYVTLLYGAAGENWHEIGRALDVQ